MTDEGIRAAKEGDGMQVWLTGDTDRQLAVSLARRLTVQIHTGLPGGPGEHVIIAAGLPAPDDVLAFARVIVLIEPELTEHDRVTRRLAARSQPRLEVVEHIGAGIRAERSWALLLSMATRIPQAIAGLATQSITQSDLVTGSPPGGSWLALERAVSLFGKTIGFAGFSPMGWKMAESAAQAGMQAVYWPEPGSRELHVEIEGAALRSGAREVSFDDLLTTSDAIVLDVCYSDANVRLIDSSELALMRPDALLINSAHGRAIDEGALIQALRDGRLSGVALDRFNYEPLPDDSPLRAFERVLLTPGITVPTDAEILERTAAEVASRLNANDEQGSVTRRVRHVRRRRTIT